MNEDEILRSVQLQVSWADRDEIATRLARSRRATTEQDAKLSADGVCRLPWSVDESSCADVVSYFSATRCYGGHVPAQSDGVLRTVSEQASGYASYALSQSISAPHLIEFATDKRLIAMAGAYLGCAPQLYSINTFWTFPAGGFTHGFHRDVDDFRFVSVFVYWTPVEIGDGEIYFIEGTHDRHAVIQRVSGRSDLSDEEKAMLIGGSSYGHAALYERAFGEYIKALPGPAGTAFAADTFGLHRGSKPITPRLCTWFRYGLYENAIYRNDATKPVKRDAIAGRLEDDEDTRSATRLVIAWD
jgi:hypothetical protein